MNNFCVSVQSNEPRCTSCHIGYGWKDKNFDFADESKVDCLVCHDTTGSYKKPATDAGLPAPDADLLYIARNVGKAPVRTVGPATSSVAVVMPSSMVTLIPAWITLTKTLMFT